MLAETPLEYTPDTSVKRNLGLIVANVAGWRRVIFLDDDIHVPDHRHLANAASLLGRYAAVGLQIGEFPDNSVVCHAHRAGKGDQETFVGTGALAIDPLGIDVLSPDLQRGLVLPAGRRPTAPGGSCRFGDAGPI
jgi:hypothetical protein